MASDVHTRVPMTCARLPAFVLLCALPFALPVLTACGSDDDEPASGGSGGASSGGRASTGGTSETGGGTASGGSTASGGAPASGGSTASGGTSASGGTNGIEDAGTDASASGGTPGADGGEAEGGVIPFEAHVTSDGKVDGVTFVPLGVVGARTASSQVAAAGIALADVSLPCSPVVEFTMG